MHPDDHMLNAFRDRDASELPGELALSDMGMKQNPCTENATAGTDHFPSIGIMIPTRVLMLNGNLKLITCFAELDDPRVHHLGRICHRRYRQRYKTGRQNRR